MNNPEVNDQDDGRDQAREQGQPKVRIAILENLEGHRSCIINSSELERLVPYSAMQFWRREQAGTFPRRVKIGPQRVGWILGEVLDWLAQRKAERDTVTPCRRPVNAPPPKSRKRPGRRMPQGEQ
jgi:prophage regulatory protein